MAGEEAPTMMATASATNKEPVTVVEKDQLEKTAKDAPAAHCVDEEPDDAIAVAGGDVKAPAASEGRRLTPLPKEEVERVLSWKRGKLTSVYSTAEAVEVFQALSDSCAEYQAWMRAEYEANGGGVLVDDEFLREQAEGIQSLKDYWKDEKLDEDDDFDFRGWHFEGDVDSPGWNLPRRPKSSEEDEKEGQEGDMAVVRLELDNNQDGNAN